MVGEVVDVRWSRDAGRARWIGERLAAFGQNTITSVIPDGFQAYARVLHPVQADPNSVLPVVRWADVARWSGTDLTPDVQFQDIALPAGTPPEPAPGAGSRPAEGSLFADDAAALVDLLRDSTGDAECWFALWEGYGWGSGVLLTVGGGHSEAMRLSDPIPREVREGPRVELPGRRYLLYSGNLTAALAWIPSQRQTPNLWWHGDHTWCVASEIDLTATYVGGPRALIDRILADERLEALPAEPGDAIQLRARSRVAQLIDEMTTELVDTGSSERVTPRGTLMARLTEPRLFRPGTLALSLQNEYRHDSHTENLRKEEPEALRRHVRRTVEWRVCAFLAGA
jgi:hypothetical protein